MKSKQNKKALAVLGVVVLTNAAVATCKVLKNHKEKKEVKKAQWTCPECGKK